MEQEIIDAEEDSHLEAIRESLKGSYFKIWKMLNDNSLPAQMITRRNMFYVYKYVYLKNEKGKRQKQINVLMIAKALGLRSESVDSALIRLCFMRKPLLKVSAIASISKNRKSPKVVKSIRLA
ncbi:hypothetical protein [Sulfurimonas sp.]|jgi:hypothetical protein|uniref:hypothetical protein n=1 Tax=Sulfurimonas sp. TaxID=2022749 RepID=UPI0025F90C37|nr:hypothetical protein [Sulfurimonas sp.]MBT5935587.1 hypothetical protein [Sulfurimonas sp.]